MYICMYVKTIVTIIIIINYTNRLAFTEQLSTKRARGNVSGGASFFRIKYRRTHANEAFAKQPIPSIGSSSVLIWIKNENKTRLKYVYLIMNEYFKYFGGKSIHACTNTFLYIYICDMRTNRYLYIYLYFHSLPYRGVSVGHRWCDCILISRKAIIFYIGWASFEASSSTSIHFN